MVCAVGHVVGVGMVVGGDGVATLQCAIGHVPPTFTINNASDIRGCYLLNCLESLYVDYKMFYFCQVFLRL